jgi:hypothetical protein
MYLVITKTIMKFPSNVRKEDLKFEIFIESYFVLQISVEAGIWYTSQASE